MRREEREDMGYKGFGKRNWIETCLSLGQSSSDMRVVFVGQTKINSLFCDNNPYRSCF